MPDESRYSNPDTVLREVARRAAEAADADAQRVLDAGRRGTGRVDVGELTAGDLQLLEARRELQAARDRMRHLEQALRAAGRVLQPYLAGGGR
jgi:phage portal protein BeeE